MKQFELGIREILSRTLSVMANNDVQTIGKIKEVYFNSCIVLDADNSSGAACYVVDIKENFSMML